MAGKNEHIQNYEMEVKEILKKNHLSAASQSRACFTSLTTVREVKNAPAKELSARREASQLKAFSVEQNTPCFARGILFDRWCR